jgi:hypothetical protein
VLLSLITVGTSIIYCFNKRSRSSSLLSFPTKDAIPNFCVTTEQEPETSRLRGKEIAEAAMRLTQEAVTYKNIHYESIESTLSSKTLDCSSFVRRVIYTAIRIDIGNIKSNRFATSTKFESFTQSSKAIPGDIVHVRGHVAICLDKECKTVSEAASIKVGLVIRATSNSAIGSSKSPVTYFRLK